MRQRWVAPLVLACVAVLAISPPIVHGCSCGHDFDFHILSWFEAAAQISHGTLHPHWAFTPAWNAGEPRFVFYPPLSWYVGALLGMMLPWAWTPIVYTWLALTAAGCACFYLLRDFAAPRTALLVAALYIVNPYMLFTAYERTAYAELLCAAWLPLLLHAILREEVTIPRVALPVALLWLTNAPAAVLGCYGLAILVSVRLVTSSNRVRLAWTASAGTALGLGLAAFYIVPAAYQQRYVEIALAKAQTMLITDNFLFGQTASPEHDAVLHTASLLAVGLLLATAVALMAARGHRHIRLSLAVLTAVIALLLTRVSTPIWLHLPELAFLQFPWRFLALLTPALAVAVALAMTSEDREKPRSQTRDLVHPDPRSALRVRWVGSWGIVLFGFVAVAVYVFYQPCDAEDTVAARLSLFHSTAGTEPTDEYTPNTADEDALGHANPPFWLGATAEAAPPLNAAAGPLHWPLDLAPPAPGVIILNLRGYPSWRITVNQRPVATRLERADGLIAIPLPAGRAHLDVHYIHTTDETAGGMLSVFSLAVLAGVTLRLRR